MGETRKSSRGRGMKPRINLIDFQPGDERPDIGVYALNRAGEPIYSDRVDAEGAFDLPENVLKEAHRIAIGPLTDDFASLDRQTLVTYRATRLLDQLKDRPELDLPRRVWEPFLFVTRCVSGRVRRCRPFPWLIRDLALKATLPRLAAHQLAARADLPSPAASAFSPALADALIAKPSISALIPPWRCEIVCDGVVEVYRRTCCIRPWIIDDPRLPELENILEGLIPVLPDPPEIHWPPRPIPDPPPERIPLVREGALDEAALNAPRDLAAIRSLPRAEVAAYVQARPYLLSLFSCGTPVKVAQGGIRNDGEFDICWREPLRLLRPFCHDEFAFVVKQNIGGLVITIYNGLAANQWFHYGDDPTLTSYHPLAQGCRHNDFPGEGAFALLQDIGDTESYHLKTPDATGWDRVAPPAYNDGLAFPVPLAADALGKPKNRNWGGTLKLRYAFSEPMKGAGATFYRISVIAADNNGEPVGARTYLSAGLSWRRYTGGGDVVPESLGPVSVGGEDNLFRIPYDADADWQSGQYHGYLDTTDFSEGRYLLTLEVFNNAGQQLKPAGTPGPGADAPFTFRRWFQEFGPTAVVPFAALTHMLWWDNRRAEARIVNLRLNGVEFNENCLFLEGNAGATLSASYYAYHPNPMFLLDHNLWWRRGIGPSPINVGSLVNPVFTDLSPVPHNVLPVGVSLANTFAQMLQGEPKCSFAINLHANVKTFDGEVTLDYLDAWDQGSFALEIV